MKGQWIRKPADVISSMTVVFVHGLLSDGDTCWRHQNGTYWPEMLSKCESIGSAGVYEFTYHTDFFSGSYDLGNIVSALGQCLRLDEVSQSRKLVFVAHSMGGIIVRRYVVQRCDELVERGVELGLFLIASPSLGSSYANWLKPIASFMGHAQGQALTFCQNNTWLNDLNNDFRNLLARRKLVVHGQELVEAQFVILKRLTFLRQVVPPFTGAAFFGDAFMVPLSNHFSIAKPIDEQAIQHRMLCDFIERIALQTDNASTISEYPGGFRANVGESEIRIVTGRIEELSLCAGTAIALPCNEYFEEACTQDKRTALGIYISKYFPETSAVFSQSVKQQCSSRFGAGKRRQRTTEETSDSYGAGRAILVPDPSQNAEAIALISTTTERAGQGLAARMSYVFDGIGELFELLADKRINEVAMPILGAGHGGINPTMALSGLVLALSEASKYGADRQRRKKITIVVFQRSKNEPPDVSRVAIRKTLELVANKA